MIEKWTKYINWVTFGIVFLFCFALDILICTVISFVFDGNDITNVEIICSYVLAIVIAVIFYSIGKLKVYEIHNSNLEGYVTQNGSKMIDLGNIKLIYKNPVSMIGYQKAFVILENDKCYFVGNKYFNYIDHVNHQN